MAKPPDLRFRRFALCAIVAMLAVVSLGFVSLFRIQAPGADYSCFWAGAKVALGHPGRLYDFDYVTALQGWPLGPAALRPFIYPPSALFAFIPFAALPYWIGYLGWVLATGALFVWAGLKVGGKWWVCLAPSAALVAYCGQATFLLGGLVTAAMMWRSRPLAAGVLLGIAAAIKPQLVLIAVVALIAQRRWRTVLAAGFTGAALCLAATLVWGPQAWIDWFAAVPRFQEKVIFANGALVADAVTPYAEVAKHGVNGAWAYLLLPFAAAWVWIAHASEADPADRSIALFTGALVATPYAMNYELALFAPAATFYLSRIGDRRWPIYAAVIVAHMVLPRTFWSVVLVAILPLLRRGASDQPLGFAPALVD